MRTLLFYTPTTKKQGRVGEMAQWAKGLAAKPDHLGLIPKTHMVEGEKKKSYKLPCDHHNIYTQIKKNLIQVDLVHPPE